MPRCRSRPIAGTATVVSNRVSRRQANRWAAKDQQQAITLLEKGCNAGDSFGCYNLATVYDGNDKTLATKYYKKACAAGDQEACQRVR